jgi:hypothetical protein
MKISTHSVLMAGVAMLTASTVAIAQSVQPAPPPAPTPAVNLVADVQLTALPKLPSLLTVLLDNPLRLLGPAATPGTLPPAPAPLAIPIAPNLADTIDAIYTSVEPWVEYGFDVAESIVRWIPYVGWFAGQIGVFYEFGESIVASGVFNFTDWLRGDGGIVENLVDFGIDVGLAFVWLGLDEVAQFVPLPPFCCYPPRPPVQGPGPSLAAETLTGPVETADLMMATSFDESMPEGTEVVEGSEEPVEQLAEGLTEDQGLTEEIGLTEEEVTEEEGLTEEEGVDDESGAVETLDETIENNDEETDLDATGVEPTTDTSGTVQAQGEVRGSGIDTTGEDTVDTTNANEVDGADGADEMDGVATPTDEDNVENATDAPTDDASGDDDAGTE